jgi:hypothetical protein
VLIRQHGVATGDEAKPDVATPVRHIWEGPFRKLIVVGAVAASVTGAAGVAEAREVRRTYSASNRTQVRRIGWSIDEQESEPVAEWVTDAQVESLNALLAIEYESSDRAH